MLDNVSQERFLFYINFLLNSQILLHNHELLGYVLFFLFDRIVVEIKVHILILLELHFTHLYSHLYHGLLIHFSHVKPTVKRSHVVFCCEILLPWCGCIHNFDVTNILLTIDLNNIFYPCLDFYVRISLETCIEWLT